MYKPVAVMFAVSALTFAQQSAQDLAQQKALRSMTDQLQSLKELKSDALMNGLDGEDLSRITANLKSLGAFNLPGNVDMLRSQLLALEGEAFAQAAGAG